MGWQAQGKKLRAAPLQQGARGAAVPCQPKPVTRPWVSAVLAIRRKEIWQGMARAFNVRLTGPARETDMVGLLNHDAHSADAAMDDDAPSRRISVGAADWATGDTP